MTSPATAQLSPITGELVPGPDPNRVLPALSPLKNRSTVAAILSTAALISPLLSGGIGEVVASIVGNGDAIQAGTEQAVDAINALVGRASLA